MSTGTISTQILYATRGSVDGVKAAQFGAFLQQVHEYIQKDPKLQAALRGWKAGQDAHDVYKGAKDAAITARYTGNLNTLVQDYGRSGGASVLGVFVDRFAHMAKAQGIKLNECALSVAKVATDIGGAGVGAVSSVTGWGLLFLGISVLSTFNDSRSATKACLNGSD